MQTRIVPNACRKVIDNGNYHYVGKIVATSHDGKQYEFAIKTRKKSFDVEQVQIRIGDKWEITTDYPAKIIDDFTEFLQLLASCFGSKLARNKLFLNDSRLLIDMTPKNERQSCSTVMTNYLCLINGEFMHIRKQKTGFGYSTVYSTRPVDMSEDWKQVSVSFETESLIAKALLQYKNKLSRYALVEYRKSMVQQGIWM